MKNINYLFFYITCCLCLLISSNSIAQTTGADSTNLTQVAVNNTLRVFNKAVGQQSALYNGPEYTCQRCSIS